MAENRYRRYLGDSSSRYSDRLESAQDKRGLSYYLTAGVATGLGLFVIGRYGHQIARYISRSLPKSADEMTTLEKAIMRRHYDIQKIKGSLLSEARAKASMRYFGKNAEIRDALVDILQSKDAHALFLSAGTNPDRLIDEVMRRTGRLSITRDELRSQIQKAVRLNREEARGVIGQLRYYRDIYDENVLFRRFSANRTGNRGILGFRPVTVGDVLNNRAIFAFTPEKRFVGTKVISPRNMTYQESVLRSLVKKDRRFENLVVSGGTLLIDPYGNTVDLRRIAKGLGRIVDESAEFHIPFVGISPYDVFGLGRFRDQKLMSQFHIFRRGEPQFIFGPHTPNVVGNIDAWRLREDLVYIGGDVFDMATGRKVASNIRLDPSQWGRTLKTYTAVGGIVGNQAEYAARQARRGRVAKVLDWLDIGRQESHSFLDKVTNAIRKWHNKAWEGTLLQQIQAADTPQKLGDAVNRLKKFIHYESRAMPDDLFNEMFLSEINKLYGKKLDLSTREGIIEAFETMGGEKSAFLSKHSGDQFRRQYYTYIRDPYLFLQGGRNVGNKFPNATMSGTLLSSTENIEKIEDIKKLIQQEMIEQYNEHTNKAAMDIAKDMLNKGRDINTKGLALDFITGHMSSNEFQDVLANDVLIGGAAREFIEARAPWYEYGPMAATGEKALANELRGSFLMVRNSYKFDYRDLLALMNGSIQERAAARENLSNYFGQFLSGRKNMERFTSMSMAIFNTPFGRIQEAASYLHLGLGPEHTGSALSIFANLILRRYLPAMLGISMLGYISWEMGNFLGKEGDELVADTADSVRQGIAWIRDTLGITNIAKRVRRLTPGSETIWELPILHFFDPSLSQQEVANEDNGEVPIRKGRWWPLGNTPFVGGKVMYYMPSFKRRAYADYKMTDVLYGSEEEYYKNAWFPTIRYPLAPLRHFIFDPYYLERKHYYDRPYPITGPISEFEDIPIAGPLISATIGRILKPPIKMHKEAMNRAYLEDIAELNKQEQIDAEDKDTGITYAKIMPAGGVSLVADVGPAGGVNEGGSGSVSGVGVGAHGSTGSGRAAIGSLNRSQKAKAASLGDRIYLPLRDRDNEQGNLIDATNPYSINYAGAKAYYGLTEMAGVKGFLLESITGQPIEEMKVIQSSERMTSYNRAFWDLELGGIGGEGNEIGRRFIPRQRRFQEDLDINPIPNNMPEWMPGDDYFINFRRGDAYVKIPRGEARLPGGGYEALWNYNPNEMVVRSSMVGKTPQEIMNYLLNVGEGALPGDVQEAMEEGTQIHRYYQRQWKKAGFLIDAESEIYDEEARVKGHYDAIIRTKQGPQIVDIKTVSQKRWDELMKRGSPYEEHIDQITTYMAATKIHKGGILYVNRETNEERFYAFNYSRRRHKQLVKKLDAIRSQIKELIDSGKISPYELYDPLHRFQILADVAPWSQEYAYYSKYVTQQYADLTGTTGPDRQEKLEAKALISKIKKRVTSMKKEHRFFPYRFKDIGIVRERVHVTDVLGNGIFLTAEHPGTPIRMGGISIPNAIDSEEQRAFLNRFIYPGARLTIGIDANEEERISNNNLGTMNAVVYAGSKNLNLRMMRAGLAKEKPNDWSPVGVHARFSEQEIAIGSIWETFAHLDTPFNTKFLHVASPLEEYRRRDVYGKSFQQWSLKDQIGPTIQGIISKDVISAALSGAILGGAIYGRSWEKRLLGIKVGALGFATLAAVRSIGEDVTGKRWIPERRRREREINEYFDILEYVKYRGLYEYAARRAKEEGFDVEQFYKDLEEKRRSTKRQREAIEAKKRKLRMEDLSKRQQALGKYSKTVKRLREEEKKRVYANTAEMWRKVDAEDKRWRWLRDRTPKWLRGVIDNLRARDEERIKQRYYAKEATIRSGFDRKEHFDNFYKKDARIRRLNKKLAQIADSKELVEIPPWGAIAMQYRQRYESTLYGADSYGGVAQIMGALPKKEREYFAEFLKAKPEERKEILELVPRNERRFLQAAYGMKPDRRPSLKEYFRYHYLPDAKWEGWSASKDLNDIKVKVIQNEGLDLSEFGFWKNDIAKAEANNAPIIDINKVNKTSDLERNLRRTLEGIGLRDVDIQIQTTNMPGTQMDVNISKDRREEMIEFVNSNLDTLL